MNKIFDMSLLHNLVRGNNKKEDKINGCSFNNMVKSLTMFDILGTLVKP